MKFEDDDLKDGKLWAALQKEIDRDLAEKESGETFQEELADIEDSIEFESKETKSEDRIPDETANLSNLRSVLEATERAKDEEAKQKMKQTKVEPVTQDIEIPEFTEEEEEIEETPAETPKKVSRVSQTTEKLEGLVDFDDDPAETKTESEPEEVMVDDDLIINDPFADEDDLLGEEKVKVDEPMKRHTTFRIGGPADYFLLPSSEEELSGILKICKNEELPYFILGNGSNLLVSDEGYRGVIIQLYRNYGDITVKGNEIHATAGALLSQIAAAAKNASLTGFEFAGGIPGTLGGAVVMNAGAYGGEMKDVLKEVTVMTAAGEILVLPAEKLEMGYRTSLVKTKGYLVLSAVIVLEQGNQEAIKARMKELTEQRVSKQPLEFPSAGSTFKRPEGYFAGKLIMDAGLRGYQTGGAQVSEKHCGFVINKDNATAADVCRLLRDVQDKVKEQFGVTLEPEVKFLGEF